MGTYDTLKMRMWCSSIVPLSTSPSMMKCTTYHQQSVCTEFVWQPRGLAQNCLNVSGILLTPVIKRSIGSTSRFEFREANFPSRSELDPAQLKLDPWMMD